MCHSLIRSLIHSLIVFCLISCGKDGGNDKPSVTTLPITNITAENATINGSIVNSGGSSIKIAGFQWDTTGTFVPTQYQDSAVKTASNNFSMTLTGLSSGTTWYVRAYATNSAGTTFGNTVHFTTDTLPSDYTVTTIAGTGYAGLGNGAALSASFNDALALAAAPDGVIYVGDESTPGMAPTNTGYVRRIGTDGTVSTFATIGSSSVGIVTDTAGNVYDLDLYKGMIYKFAPAGAVDTVATGLVNPMAFDIDNLGNFYVTCAGKPFPNYNYRIVKINTAGVKDTLPVTATTGFFAIAVDHANNNIYISDGAKIEKIDTLGNVSFIAGGNGAGDGIGSNAGFGGGVTELRVDRNGNIIAANPNVYKIRMITPAGVVTTIAGNGTAGDVDGSASRANFKDPVTISTDAAGNIFVSDIGTHKIKRITHK